jgi:hypothetical protein
VPRAYRVDLAADAVGVLVLVNGSSAVAPMTLWWPPGGTLSLGAESIQVHARTRYIFSHWSDGGAQNRQMVVSAPVGLKAFFAVEFELTVDTDPPGGNVTVDGLTSEGPRSVWGSPGVAHTVSVRPLVALHPSARLVWVAWSDGGAIVHSVSIAAPTNLSASFEHWFLVTLESERGGVSCDAADCWYASGSSATLRAARYVPGAQGERFRFLGWSASIVNRSLEVTVTVRNPYVARAEWSQEFLLEAKSPYGEVVGAGWYAASSDARVGVNATTVEVEGRVYHFVRWEGDVGSGEPEVVVHMNAPHQLTAVWQQAALQAEPFPAVFLVLPAAALLIGIAFLFWRARRAPR